MIVPSAAATVAKLPPTMLCYAAAAVAAAATTSVGVFGFLHHVVFRKQTTTASRNMLNLLEQTAHPTHLPMFRMLIISKIVDLAPPSKPFQHFIFSTMRESKNDVGLSTFYTAIYLEDRRLVDLMMKYGEDPNPPLDKISPLYFALGNSDVPTIRVLLRGGAKFGGEIRSYGGVEQIISSFIWRNFNFFTLWALTAFVDYLDDGGSVVNERNTADLAVVECEQAGGNGEIHIAEHEDEDREVANINKSLIHNVSGSPDIVLTDGEGKESLEKEEEVAVEDRLLLDSQQQQSLGEHSPPGSAEAAAAMSLSTPAIDSSSSSTTVFSSNNHFEDNNNNNNNNNNTSTSTPSTVSPHNDENKENIQGGEEIEGEEEEAAKNNNNNNNNNNGAFYFESKEKRESIGSTAAPPSAIPEHTNNAADESTTSGRTNHFASFQLRRNLQLLLQGGVLTAPLPTCPVEDAGLWFTLLMRCALVAVLSDADGEEDRKAIATIANVLKDIICNLLLSDARILHVLRNTTPFDVRQIFCQMLACLWHKRPHPQDAFVLPIDDGDIVGSSMQRLLEVPPSFVRVKGLCIVLSRGSRSVQQGADYGGLRREWITRLTRVVFNPNYGVVMPTSSIGMYQLNPSLEAIGMPIEQAECVHEFIGMVLGIALLYGDKCEMDMVPSFYRELVGDDPEFDDMKYVDESLHHTLSDMAKLNRSELETMLEACELTFSTASRQAILADCFGMETTGILRMESHLASSTPSTATTTMTLLSPNLGYENNISNNNNYSAFHSLARPNSGRFRPRESFSSSSASSTPATAESSMDAGNAFAGPSTAAAAAGFATCGSNRSSCRISRTPSSVFRLPTCQHPTLVTAETFDDFRRLLAAKRLVGNVSEAMIKIKKGMTQVVGDEFLALLSAEELQTMLEGEKNISVEDWKKSTRYDGFEEDSPQVEWWWEHLASLPSSQLSKVLQWATGATRLPSGGFSQIPFVLHCDKSDPNRLPQASTCSFSVHLPLYESKEVFVHKFSLALEEQSFELM